jgi:hypothetical protein
MKILKDWERNIAGNTYSLSAPMGYKLWDQATEAKGHISLQAVSDEYERLLREQR